MRYMHMIIIILTLALMPHPMMKANELQDEVSSFSVEAFGPEGTARGLEHQQVQTMERAFIANPAYQRMQNAVTITPVHDLALNRAIVTRMDNTFSHKLDDWSVTSQKNTGRCWMFAGLNLLRVGAMKKMNLKDFQFSQNYLFFWDKIERSNYFLESIINTAHRPDGDRVVDFLLDNPINDGGQWNMFVNLIKKYGVVPQAAMPETESSSNSSMMNRMICFKLREGAKRLRDMHTNTTPAALQSAKHEILTVIYRICCIHMGTPPASFTWQWRNKENEFKRDSQMTPQQFAQKYITLDVNEYLCIVHDPRPTSPTNRTFTVAFLGNVVGGDPVLYLNVEMSLMKKLTQKALLDEEPVWFGCDVGPHMSRDLGIWDSRLYDYEGIYDTSFQLNKAERLMYHQSSMTHAMLFTGVDVVNNQARRWRVENSWGKDTGKDGFFNMNDSWFDEYVFELAVKKSELPVDLQKAIELKPIILPPWDPMGSLAR